LPDALLDGAALLDLRFQAAAGALGFDAHFGKLPPRFGELLLEAVASGLLALVRLLPFGHPFTERLQLGEARLRSMAVLAASRSSKRYWPESTTRRRASSSSLSSA